MLTDFKCHIWIVALNYILDSDTLWLLAYVKQIIWGQFRVGVDWVVR